MEYRSAVKRDEALIHAVRTSHNITLRERRRGKPQVVYFRYMKRPEQGSLQKEDWWLPESGGGERRRGGLEGKE